MDAILLHFHEITLKGRNRPMFEHRLLNNIKIAAAAHGIKIKSIKNTGGGFLIEPCLPTEILSKIFGIANFMLVFESVHLKPIVDKCVVLEELGKHVLEELKTRNFKTFRITASTEISNKLGEFVKNHAKKIVDLENPDLTIFVEFLKGKFYFGFEKIKGVCGLPVGVSGNVVSLLSGGIDSPVASFMLMKRGCRVTFVHFHGHPYLSRASAEKAGELAKILNEYQFGSRLYLVPFGEIQRQVVLKVPSSLRVIIYRRLMLKIAEEVAKKENARALVTGESLGQVASQTLENIGVITKAVSLTVLRPLLGMDKEEIIDRAKKIGTYEISILPDEDCCQLFMPKNPETKAREEMVLAAESELEIEIKEGLGKTEIKDII